jgi:transposase
LTPRTSLAAAVTLAVLAAKTDRVDALHLLDFAERTEFVPWAPPSEAVLQLRDLSRHISALADDKTAAVNQLHSAHAKQGTPQLFVDDLVASVASLKARVEHLTTAAVELAMWHDELRASMQVLATVNGIADRSAVRIMGELLTLQRT